MNRLPIRDEEVLVGGAMHANNWIMIVMFAQRCMQVRVLIPDQSPGTFIVILEDVIVPMHSVRKPRCEVCIVGQGF